MIEVSVRLVDYGNLVLLGMRDDAGGGFLATRLEADEAKAIARKLVEAAAAIEKQSRTAPGDGP